MNFLIFYVIIKQNIFYLTFMANINNPDQIDLFSIEEKKDRNNFWYSQRVNSILEQISCPNCWDDYFEALWCKNCWYWVLSWDFEINDDISYDLDKYVQEELKKQNALIKSILNLSWEITVEQNDLNKKNKLVVLDSKLNWNDVIYTKQHLHLSPQWDKIYLQIWESKYKIWIKYEIQDLQNYTDSEWTVIKIAQNLKITFISKKYNRTFKKSFLKTSDFKELCIFISREILNNPHLNYSII